MMHWAYIMKHKNVFQYIFIVQYLFILLIIWITLSVLNQLEKLVISEGGSQSSSLTHNGAWCWFADPRAIYYKGKKKKPQNHRKVSFLPPGEQSCKSLFKMPELVNLARRRSNRVTRRVHLNWTKLEVKGPNSP